MKTLINVNTPTHSQAENDNDNELVFAVLTQRKAQAQLAEMVLFASEKQHDLTEVLGASIWGRMQLMLIESNDFEDFKKRIQSIKSENKREKALCLLNEINTKFSSDCCSFDKNENWKQLIEQVLITAKYFLRSKEGEAVS